MPLLSGGRVVDTPAPPVDTGPTAAYHETVGTPAFTWIDSDGTSWPLSNTSEDLGWFTVMGPSGWGAAPVEITTDPSPRGGETVRQIGSKPSTLQWPLEIFGSSHTEFLNRYRRIARAFKLTTVRQQPGTLRVQRPDGTAREILAFYSDGLGGESEQNHLFARPVLSLYCPDGKWHDSQQTVLTRTFPATSGGDPAPAIFYSPFISVSDSKVVGADPGFGADPVAGDGSGGSGGPTDPNAITTLNNTGDVEAWPTWTINGPITELRAWNLTLGSRFTLTYNLTALQSITITTDPPTVRGPGGINLSKFIDWFNDAGTELWPLADGANIIGLEVDGTGATTSVQLSFYPRYDNS